MRLTTYKLAIGLVLAVTSAGPAAGQGLLVGAACRVSNRTGEEVNDFHIDATFNAPGGNPLLFDEKGGAFSSFGSSFPGNGPTYEASFDWSGGGVLAGEETELGIYMLVDGDNAMYDVQASWTQNGTPIGPAVDLPGFLFEPVGGGDLRYTIYNDSSSTITVSDLQFKPDSPFVLLGDLSPGAIPGFGAPVPEFDLASGASADFLLGGVGDFSLAQGTVSDTKTGEWQIDFIEIHQVVPEPASWLLIVLPVLLHRRAWRA